MSENGASSPSDEPAKKLTLAPKEPATSPAPEEQSEAQPDPVAAAPAESTPAEEDNQAVADAPATPKPAVKPGLRPATVRPGIKPLARPGIVSKTGTAIARPGITSVPLPSDSKPSDHPQLEDDLDDLDQEGTGGPLTSPAWTIIDAIAACAAIAAAAMLYIEISG